VPPNIRFALLALKSNCRRRRTLLLQALAVVVGFVPLPQSSNSCLKV
jgi:hypothetical protein